MPISKKTKAYQGLKDVPVLVDNAVGAFRLSEVPIELPLGKSSFLVGGSGELKSNVEIKVELLDSAGNPIYTSVVPDYLEGNARRVSIEVYDDVAPGEATLYLLGELSKDQLESLAFTSPPDEIPVEPAKISPEWINVYNARTMTTMFVNPAANNTQPILFYKQPKIKVSEIRKGNLDVTRPAEYLTHSPGTIKGSALGQNGNILPRDESDVPGSDVSTNTGKLEHKAGLVKATGIDERGRVIRRTPGMDNRFTVSVSGGTFNLPHVGGKLFVANPIVDTAQFATESFHSGSGFTTKIIDVLNTTTLVTENVYTITNTKNDDKLIAPFKDSPYEITFTPAPTQSENKDNIRSFGSVEITDMTTFSGDIFRVKLYAKPEGSIGDFERVADEVVGADDVLTISGSVSENERLGYFVNQSHVNSYWSVGNNSNTTLTHDSTKVLNSLIMSGSTSSDYIRAEVGPGYAVGFNPDVEYAFRARLIGVGASSKLAVHFSGSSFGNNNSALDKTWGYQLEVDEQLAEFQVPDTADEYDFGEVAETFTPDLSGSGVVQFRGISGQWYISDVSVSPLQETNISPDTFTLTAPLPVSQKRPERYKFMAEFYDVNNNIAETVAILNDVSFVGSNLFIDGDDNVLSGSVYMSDVIGGGIELSGKSSAMIKSSGYVGFSQAVTGGGLPGYMLYSGSVLADTGNNYSGVGMEMVGSASSSLRFRTSTGKLEISGSIVATEGQIAQFNITGSVLSGTNIDIQSSGAVIKRTDRGPEDGYQSNGFYIDFTPEDQGAGTKYYLKFGDKFGVTSDGVAEIAGGTIQAVAITTTEGATAGFTIKERAMYTVVDSRYFGLSSHLTASANVADGIRLFAGATNISGAYAPFVIHDSGKITSTHSGSVWHGDGSNLTGITAGAEGSNTYVQFNDAGLMAGDAGFTYNKTTDSVSIAGTVSGSTLNAFEIISGSVTSTGSFGALRVTGQTLKMDSSGSVSGSVTSTGSFGAILFAGFLSGSAGTTASFSHVLFSGSLSGSASSTGSFGMVYVSGSVSGSATSTGSFGSVYTSENVNAASVIATSTGSFGSVFASQDAHAVNVIATTTGSFDYVKATSKVVGGPTSTGSFNHIDSFARLSGSSTSTGSFGSIEFAGNISGSTLSTASFGHLITRDTPWADIRAFGANTNVTGSGWTNTIAIQNAIDYVSGSGGGTVYFPRGTYELSRPITSSLDNMTFYADSAVLECNHPYSGIVVSGSLSGDNPDAFTVEGNLHVTRPRAKHPVGTADGSKGIELINVDSSKLRGISVSYFNYGLWLEGKGASTSYNVFEPIEMKDNLFQCKFAVSKSDDGSRGWVNQNTFIGGRWSYSSYYRAANNPPHSADEGAFIDMSLDLTPPTGSDDSYQNNGNNFMRLSMECSSTIADDKVAPAAICHGTRNVFQDCRAEHTRGFDFNHISASYNTVHLGRFVNSAPGAGPGAPDDIITYYTGSDPWDLGNNFIGVRRGDVGSHTKERWGTWQKVGIGTFDPQEELHVSASKATVKIEGDGGSPSWRARLMIERNDPERAGGIWINESSSIEDAWWIGPPYNGGSAPGSLAIGYHATQPEYIDNALFQITTDGAMKTEAGTATSSGGGFDATNVIEATYVANINGEIITTLLIDIGAGSIVSSGDADDVIGENATANAYITKITTAINGIIYRGEMSCIEVPTTGDPDINLCADSSGTVAEDAGSMDHVLVNGGTWTLGQKTDLTIPSGGIVNDWLYLTHGGTTSGTYDAGKFIIKLYGATF